MFFTQAHGTKVHTHTQTVYAMHVLQPLPPLSQKDLGKTLNMMLAAYTSSVYVAHSTSYGAEQDGEEGDFNRNANVGCSKSVACVVGAILLDANVLLVVSK